MNLLRWNGAGVEPQYDEADPGMIYTISGAMQFNEEDQFWHFGLRLALTGMQWAIFGLGVADRDGKAMVRIGPGNARQIDLSDQNQCNEFYDSIVESIKHCYRDDGNIVPKAIGFCVGGNEEEKGAAQAVPRETVSASDQTKPFVAA
jgi:hypothetical protein